MNNLNLAKKQEKQIFGLWRWEVTSKCLAPCKFQQPQGISTASRWAQLTRLALLQSFDLITRILNWIFLIDKGAAPSLFPAGQSDRFKKGDVTLGVANISIINTRYGSRQLILDSGLPGDF